MRHNKTFNWIYNKKCLLLSKKLFNTVYLLILFLKNPIFLPLFLFSSSSCQPPPFHFSFCLYFSVYYFFVLAITLSSLISCHICPSLFLYLSSYLSYIYFSPSSSPYLCIIVQFCLSSLLAPLFFPPHFSTCPSPLRPSSFVY